MSKFGRYLLKDQEDFEYQAYTPMRYVSENELNQARKKHEECLYPHEIEWWNRTLRPLPVIVDNGTFRTDAYIRKPEFYRVDIETNRHGQFTRACSGGLPVHWANGIWKNFQNHLDRKELEAVEARRERETEMYLDSLRKKEWIKRQTATPRNDGSKQFFEALSMAGAVLGK
jgi:hypothetical protein